jgi:hypothetical protein
MREKTLTKTEERSERVRVKPQKKRQNTPKTLQPGFHGKRAMVSIVPGLPTN